MKHKFTVRNGVLTGYEGPGGNIALPHGTIGIGKQAFSGHTGLERVALPKSVARIGRLAFYGCSVLTVRAPVGSHAERYTMENGIPFEALGA